MVKFLLHRPIAVVMAFLAALIIGVATYFALPVSLLPAIDIPQITVQIAGDGRGARELENTITAPVRRQLLQVSGLSEIKSQTRDGMSVIRMQFDYGVNTDLAFIEVNEKIDAAMNSLPRDTRRPKAIKASATDIPVLYLNMTLRDESKGDFLEMAEVVDNVIRRRIEQMPEIAIADITGMPSRQLRIVPDADLMSSMGMTIDDIESALSTNNAEPGSMTVRDGYYEYNVNISNQLRTPGDVENIYIRKGDRLIQLRDFCDVSIVADNPDGYSYSNGKRAVTLAIIKQSDENMNSMKDALHSTTEYFASLYPDIEFTESRNQTQLLDYTISNLVQNLIIGFILVFILTALFMDEVKSSIVVGLTIVSSVIITFLLFYLFGVSINIISLSGLILAVGMMIDNSVIVTENITQYRQRGYSLMEACDFGTTEMITPMLSSSLTTVAVFVPLVFMSGIAGAIFADQAFSITAGLAVSYLVGILLLPVLYSIVFRTSKAVKSANKSSLWLEKAYTRTIDWCFAHKGLCVISTLATIPVCVWLFFELPVERMPQIDRTETLARIEWGENISIDENSRRVAEIMASSDTAGVDYHSAYIGIQDYLLDKGSELSPSEAELYVRVTDPDCLAPFSASLTQTLSESYPRASVEFLPADNIFDKIFTTDEAELEARLSRSRKNADNDIEGLMKIEATMTDNLTPLHERILLVIDRERLLLYKIGYEEVAKALKTAFKGNTSGTLRSYQQYIPITIAGDDRTVDEVLSQTIVRDIPLSNIVSVARDQDLKNITAGRDGEYVPIEFNGLADPEAKMASIRETINANDDWEIDFAGSIFSNRQMMKELVVILLISLMLMYFILCAQFGSFMQPLIVLLEIPIDTAFALITLWLCGHTLNLMSAIGIIVTCGIVVNDSILKLDAINEYRSQGMALMEAIHTAGVRRLRPIIMTSLTTIVAMVPMLFTDDMGSELQRPLAIAMIGSMVVGTLVSIFIIPVIYWLIYRKNEKATA